jgi:hypothetical protein
VRRAIVASILTHEVTGGSQGQRHTQ